jgi:hypothetical protein
MNKIDGRNIFSAEGKEMPRAERPLRYTGVRVERYETIRAAGLAPDVRRDAIRRLNNQERRALQAKAKSDERRRVREAQREAEERRREAEREAERARRREEVRIARNARRREKRREAKIAVLRMRKIGVIQHALRSRTAITINLVETKALGMSDVSILNYIASLALGKWVIEVNNVVYTLNDETKRRILKLIEENLVVSEEYTESDGRLSQEIYEADTIVATPLNPRHVNQRRANAFFKYNNLTNIDLSRYGVYVNNQPTNYNDTCLVVALRNGGLDEVRIETLKRVVKNRIIPKSDLEKVCEMLKIQIRLKTEDSKKNNRNIFGKAYDEIYNIGSLDEHAFIIEPVDITSYAVKNYNQLKDIPNFNHITGMNGKYYIRNSERCIDSFDVIKILLENKDTLLKPITLEDELIASTQFYDMLDKFEITNLEYSEANYKPVKMPNTNNDDKVNVFFDFETNPNGVHKPYLCRTFDGLNHREFIGEDCALKMLFSLTKNTRLIAHNATYDLRFIIQHLRNIKELARGTRLISGHGMFRKLEIEIKDSYHLISMPLREFPKVFNLQGFKEIMPYTLYTEENIQKRFVPIDEALTLISNSDKEQFLNNIERWNCKVKDTFDIIKYSSEYCKIDCEILYNGYVKFRSWMNTAFNLDIDYILTSASLAHRYFISQGCYDDVYELGGVPQLFIQGCVVGGRVMCADNKKLIVEEVVNDFDAVSLYPSAMSRMDGFLKGTPKIIKNLSYEWLKQQDGYFVDIRITNVGIHRKFPLMSYKNDEGVRVFSNDMEGRIMRVDKYTLEDMITFQNISFDIIRGYYFNEGFNTKIREVINFIFNKRLEMKKENNPIEMTYKLIMNSGYGKSIMKPVDTESKFFDTYKGDDEFQTYLSRNYNWITSYVKFGTKIKVNLVKTLIDHFNIAQVGVCILSNSKRIMNEVMCLAEDNNIDLYYQDTDSIHLKNSDINTLSTLFNNKYHRTLIGKQMGQFHSDFKLKGCSNIVSVRSIFLGKKCYVDKLQGVNSKGEIETGYHIRMKGIPEKCIDYVVDNSNKYNDVMDLYQDLYDGNVVNFDLTNGGSKANFKFNKDYSIETLSFFSRKIKF